MASGEEWKRKKLCHSVFFFKIMKNICGWRCDLPTSERVAKQEEDFPCDWRKTNLSSNFISLGNKAVAKRERDTGSRLNIACLQIKTFLLAQLTSSFRTRLSNQVENPQCFMMNSFLDGKNTFYSTWWTLVTRESITLFAGMWIGRYVVVMFFIHGDRFLVTIGEAVGN